VPADGGQAFQVTYDGGHESFESPDGKLLYYEDYGIKGLLRSISTENSSGPREGTVVLSALRPGFWAVTENGIYFVRFDDRHADPFTLYFFVAGASEVPQPIMFYDFKTKKFSQIGAIEKPLIRPAPGFSVTWDGRYIAWSQVDRAESDLMMIENFR